MPDELDEPEEPDELEEPEAPEVPEELDEPADEDERLLDPVPPEPVPLEPVPLPELLVAPDPVPAGEPDDWVEPGSVAATAPVAIMLATPTPAVTVVTRRRPRRLRADGVSGLPFGFLDIGGSSPDGSVLAALAPRLRDQAGGKPPN